MRLRLILIIGSLSFLWSCEKQDSPCDGKFVPTVTTNSPLQAGDSLKLSVSGVGDVFMYNWRGPNGFFSHDSTPFIEGASGANNGRYTVDVITKTGCIYTAVTDSVEVGAAVLPCSLTNNHGNISGLTDLDFTYITAGPSGGTYVINASGSSGDMQIEFFNNTKPANGVYTVEPLGGNWGPKNVHFYFVAASSYWYGSPGTAYVSTANGKITVTICHVDLYSPTFSFHTTGSVQVTTP